MQTARSAPSCRASRITWASNADPRPWPCHPSSTRTPTSITLLSAESSSSHGAAVAIPITTPSAQATIETPPTGAARCRAVRIVSRAIGTWYRRVRLA